MSISKRLQHLKRKQRLARRLTRLRERGVAKNSSSAILPMPDVDGLRREAERCRRLAMVTIDLVEKNVLQRMAGELLRRAQAAEMHK